MKTTIHFLTYPAQFFLEWEIFQIEVVGKINHTFCVQWLFLIENLATFVVMGKNNVEPDREKYCRVRQATNDNITQRICVACCVPKATDTHSEYVIFTAFPLQKWLHKFASILHYTYIACLVNSKGLSYMFLHCDIYSIQVTVRIVPIIHSYCNTALPLIRHLTLYRQVFSISLSTCALPRIWVLF
jgi:hypothetical protein